MALTTRLCSLPWFAARPSGSIIHNGASKVLPCWKSPCRLSSTRIWRSGSAKLVQTLKNDPFIKLSLSLCVIVLGGTLVIELHNKFKKKTSHAVCLLPPTFAHQAVKRSSLLGQLGDELQKVRDEKHSGCPVLYITGPAGCGKTQLLHQYCDQYVRSHQYKWLGLKRVSPVVLYLDAASPDILASSLTEAVKQIGLKDALSLDENVSALVSSLNLKQVPWLLVVDNLTEKTKMEPPFTLLAEHVATLDSDSNKEGSVLVASQDLHANVESMSIPSRLTKEEACELLECVGELKCVGNEAALLESLSYHPMATALAASTIHIYQSLLHSHDQNVVSTYKELLMNRTSSGEEVLQATLALFFEAAVSDPCLRHTYDMIGSLDLNYPFLASIIPIHLSSQFYAIPSELLHPPTKPLIPDVDDKSSYWEYVKSYISFLQSKPIEIASVPQDKISFLRNCPVFSFKHYSQEDIELVTVHSSAVPILRQLFAEGTCPKLDNNHCKLKAHEFRQNAWFQKYRTFDEKNCLVQFHRGLPGLASPGVLTAREFSSFSVHDGTSVGTKVPDNLQYSQYVHIVSHYHRVTESLLSALESVKGEVSGYLLEKSLLPHLNAVKDFPLISRADRLAANIAVTSIQAASLSGDDLNKCLSSYESLVNEQRKLLGSQSTAVVCTLIDYAELLLSTGKALEAKAVLHSVLSNYKQLTAQARDQVSLDVGHAMSALGLAYAQLGEHEESKKYYEHALSFYQTSSVPVQVNKKQQKLISSLLIDVAHAHLVLGDLPMAKKYSELGIMVLQSLYPDGNLETVRLLKISSIINSLLGDKEESTKLIAKASKIEVKHKSLLCQQ